MCENVAAAVTCVFSTIGSFFATGAFLAAATCSPPASELALGKALGMALG